MAVMSFFSPGASSETRALRWSVLLGLLGLFDEARNGGDRAALAARLDALLPGGACSGYLHDRAGMDHGHSHAA